MSKNDLESVESIQQQIEGLFQRVYSLQTERDEVEYRLVLVKQQIETAKATAHNEDNKDYLNTDWYIRANAAMRHLGRDNNILAREIAELNRQIRKLNNDLENEKKKEWRTQFCFAAYRLLPKDLYDQIVDNVGGYPESSLGEPK